MSRVWTTCWGQVPLHGTGWKPAATVKCAGVISSVRAKGATPGFGSIASGAVHLLEDWACGGALAKLARRVQEFREGVDTMAPEPWCHFVPP